MDETETLAPSERIVLLTAAQEVLDAMKEAGHFEGIDLDSLSTTIVGFAGFFFLSSRRVFVCSR